MKVGIASISIIENLIKKGKTMFLYQTYRYYSFTEGIKLSWNSVQKKKKKQD